MSQGSLSSSGAKEREEEMIKMMELFFQAKKPQKEELMPGETTLKSGTVVQKKVARIDRTGSPKVYRDVISGDSLFSSSQEVRVFRESLYEVIGSEEERAGGVSVIDVVADHHLEEVTFATKEDYAAYLKAYLKRVERKLDETGRDEELAILRRTASAAKNRLLNHFAELTFYSGRSKAIYGAVGSCQYRQVDGEVRPVLTFFKAGVARDR